MDGNPDKNNFYEINQAYLEYKPLFDKAKEIFDFAGDCTEHLDSRKMKSENLSDYQNALSLLFYKSFKTFLSILVLCNKGHGEDAMILTRTIFENHVATKYIQKDQEKHSKQFLYYDFLWKRLLLGQANFPQQQRDYVSENKDSILANYEKVKPFFIGVHEKDENRALKKFRRGRWAGISIREMADAVGLILEYEYIFTFHSFFVHSDVRGTGSFCRSSPSQNSFVCSASTECILPSLVQSPKYFLSILNEWSIAFNLNKTERINRFREEIQDLEINFLKKNGISE